MKKINNYFYDIGIDVAELNRFENLSEKFIKRFLTTNEYADFLKVEEKNKTKFLASRWALKEAVFKATSKWKPIPFIHLEFRKHPDGYIQCTTFNNIKVSLTYSKDKVFAIALTIQE